MKKINNKDNDHIDTEFRDDWQLVNSELGVERVTMSKREVTELGKTVNGS